MYRQLIWNVSKHIIAQDSCSRHCFNSPNVSTTSVCISLTQIFSSSTRRGLWRFKCQSIVESICRVCLKLHFTKISYMSSSCYLENRRRGARKKRNWTTVAWNAVKREFERITAVKYRGCGEDLLNTVFFVCVRLDAVR